MSVSDQHRFCRYTSYVTERSAQEGVASQSRRLVESQQQNSALQSHLLELYATINKERKRHREELEKMTEDNALIKGERETQREVSMTC